MVKRALSEYKRKRDFSETPEPGPVVGKKSKKLGFVVLARFQKKSVLFVTV
jgi:hypothetical protein